MKIVVLVIHAYSLVIFTIFWQFLGLGKQLIFKSNKFSLDEIYLEIQYFYDLLVIKVYQM